MEDISSVLDSFDIKGVTRQYCDNLRKERGEKLSRKDREKLEHIIREFRSEPQSSVLAAIIVYAIFSPDEALQYAKQKGVFYYGSDWEHTEYCLENLASLSETLHFSQSQQAYFNQKLSCRWLRHFYRDTEEKLIRDIKRHFKERLKGKVHGIPYESSLIIELLAYINWRFRNNNDFQDKVSTTDSTDINYECVEAYSNAEVSEAASYLIYLFTKEKGFRPQYEKWLDVNYVLDDKIKKLVLLACQRNMILEWEFLIDCLGYELEADEKSIRIFDPTEKIEKSIRIGFIKTSMREQLSVIHSMELPGISLSKIAQTTVDGLGEKLFEWRSENKLIQRYQMKFPTKLLEPLRPQEQNGKLELFQEEYTELSFAIHELAFKNADAFKRMVTENCSVVDLILFKRFFILVNFSQIWLFKNIKDPRKMIPSLVPVMGEEQLLDIIGKFVNSKEKANELLKLLTWKGQDKLDLQYTPIIKIDSNHYYVSMDILISSNIVRNSLVLARYRKIRDANSDGQNDPLEIFCEQIFQECSFSYQTRSNIKYKYRGEHGEIDFLAWSDDRMYIIECKNAILPSSSHEIRATYECIQKASHQLDMSFQAMQDEVVQKTYFSQWGISIRDRTIHTCILLGNRIFAMENGMRHPVRYAQELHMVLTSGVVTNGLGRWSCWAGNQFTDGDLARYLSDADPLSKSFCESMTPYTETFRCRGKKMQLNSYAYNPLLHMEKLDKYLKIIDKDDE